MIRLKKDVYCNAVKLIIRTTKAIHLRARIWWIWHVIFVNKIFVIVQVLSRILKWTGLMACAKFIKSGSLSELSDAKFDQIHWVHVFKWTTLIVRY